MATLNGMSATFKKIPETTHKALIDGDEVIPFAAMDGTFYYITRDELFNQLGGLTAGFVGVIDTTDVLTEDGIYIPETSGIYNNADGIVIDTADGLNLIIKNGSIYQKAVIPVPVPENKIPQWEVGSYVQGRQVLNGGSVWEATENTSQEPNGATTDWDRVVWGSDGNIFMGQIDTSSPLNSDGLYIPIENGVYPNADEIEVDVTDGFTVIIKNGDIFDKVVYPVSQPLIKNNMEALRDISGDELMRLQSGFYKFVQLQGYYDGETYDQPINYFWVDDSTAADDGGSVIQVTGVATGRFIHQFQDWVNPVFFGAKCDGATIDTDAWQNTINYCGPAAEGIREIRFNGDSVVDKTLYMSVPGITIQGQSVNTSRIIKVGNDPYVGFGTINGINYDEIDAILMSVDSVGDFTLNRVRFVSNDSSEYGLCFPRVYRFMIDDIYVESAINGIVCMSSWNCNIRKTRVRFSTSAFVFEGGDPLNPNQQTSLNLDNTYAEYCEIGYKLVNMAYFSGSALSADNVTECAYWFDYSTGVLNGVGTEGSAGQLIRCHRSNIEINGHKVLNIHNYTGIPLGAQTKAKIEVTAGGRSNTGLSLNSSFIQGYPSGMQVGDAEYLFVGSGAQLRMKNHNHNVIILANINQTTINGIYEKDNADSYIREQGTKRYEINSVAPLPYRYSYNENVVIKRPDEVVIVNTSASDASLTEVTVLLSDIKLVFDDIDQTDGFIRDWFMAKLRTGLNYSITPFSGTNNVNASRIARQPASGPYITNVEIDSVSGEVTFTFNASVNRPVISVYRAGSIAAAVVPASADSASDPGATYSQTEIQAILNELRTLKSNMRLVGRLEP